MNLFNSSNTEYTSRGRQTTLQCICSVQSNVLWQDETKKYLLRFSCNADKRLSTISSYLSLEKGYEKVKIASEI